MKPQKKKIVKFVPKPRVWKLKDEETARLFIHEMAARNDEVTKADDIQKKWLLMKEIWLKGFKQVCGMMKGPPRHKETWWWNRDVEKVVAKRKVCHKAWRNNRSMIDYLMVRKTDCCLVKNVKVHNSLFIMCSPISKTCANSFFDRSFVYAAPTLWNALDLDI